MDRLGSDQTLRLSGLCERLIESYALDGQILHLSIFARTNGHDQNKYASKMQRFTQRRRNLV